VRRYLVGSLLGAALALPAVTALAALAPAASGVSLSGDADSSPLEATFLATTVSTTPLVDGQFPHAQADVASSVQATAHGTVFDPGALVQTLPYEINSNCPPPSPFPATPPPVVGCPQFPAYPFEYDADSGRPHNAGSVAGNTVGPMSFAGGEYDLNVGDGAADAVASGARATLALPEQLTVTSGSAHANVSVQGDRVVSTVTQRLQGVVLAGVIDIGAVDSTVTTSAVAGRPGAATGTLSVSGVTVAGQAATIDQNGIHLAGQTLPLPTGQAQQVLQQLQQAGLEVKLLAPAPLVAQGHSSYDGAALQVTETAPDGSSVSVRLGGARASAVAVPFSVPPPASAGFGGPSLAAPAGTLPAAAPPPAGAAGGGSRIVLRLAGFALTPLQLLIALAALLEALLLAGAVTVLWPHRTAPPAPTLRAL
jgi:hypothetical protein